METATEPATLEIERMFNATPEQVFDAFTTPEAIKAWFCPGTCHVTRADMDFTEGGRYRFRVCTDTIGEAEIVGTYRDISRPGRLAFTWRWEDNPELAPADSLVEITFQAQGESTLLRLKQTGIEDEQTRVEHGYGWNGSFDKLERQFI